MVKQWINDVVVSYGRCVGDISYRFCSDEEILQVNNQYLQHDYYTDVITFDYSEGNTVSGDVFISLDTVHSNSAIYGVTFENELLRVLIHAALHLCGLNDKTDSEEMEMRRAEDAALEVFRNLEDKSNLNKVPNLVKVQNTVR